MTLSCYVCRKVINGYEHFNEVRRIPSIYSLIDGHRTQARPGQPQRAENAGKCLLWDKVEERHQKEVHMSQFCLFSCSRYWQVEEAQKKAIADYRKEHPEMGEDTLQVDLPKATEEAGGSRPQRRRRRVPPYERIEPLRPAQDPELNRQLRLHEAINQHHMRGPAAGIVPPLQLAGLFQRVLPPPVIPGGWLPQPQPDPMHPVGAGQRPQEIQEAPRERAEEDARNRGDNCVHLRRLAQQRRVLAGKFIGNNLRGPRPAALPDDPIHSMPIMQGNRAGGVRMNPVDRGRVDEWRRGIPGPEDGTAL